MELTTMFAATGGAIIALAGVGIAEVGHWRRSVRAERAAERTRAEGRRAELWQLSLPAAARIRDSFAAVGRVTSPRSPWDEDQEWDDEGFDEWWDKEQQQVLRDIALIPSSEFRSFLTEAITGVSHSWALSKKEGLALGQQSVAADVGRIGFDVVSSWMRDEQALEIEVRTRIDALKASIVEAREQFEA